MTAKRNVIMQRTVPENSIFIIGSVINHQDINYQALFEKLICYPTYIENFSPMDLIIFNEVENISELNVSDITNALVCYMSLCKTVVTLIGWEECPIATKIVEIARLMDKEVLLSVQYFRKLDYEGKSS